MGADALRRLHAPVALCLLVGFFPSLAEGWAPTHYKLSIYDVKGGNAVDACQFSEVKWFVNGVQQTVASVTALKAKMIVDTEWVDQLKDGLTSTKFISRKIDTGHMTEVIFQLSTGAWIDSFQMFTANDEESRDPKSWVLQASDDNVAYYPVQFVTDASLPSGRLSGSSFTVSSTDMFMLELVLHSPKVNSALQISEFKVYNGATPLTARGASGLATGAAMSHNGQIAIHAVDGNIDTKIYASVGHGSIYAVYPIASDSDPFSSITKYELYTGEDEPNRDPIAWTLYHVTGVSASGTPTRLLLDDQLVTPPTARKASYGEFTTPTAPSPPPAPPPPPPCACDCASAYGYNNVDCSGAPAPPPPNSPALGSRHGTGLAAYTESMAWAAGCTGRNELGDFSAGTLNPYQCLEKCKSNSACVSVEFFEFNPANKYGSPRCTLSTSCTQAVLFAAERGTYSNGWEVFIKHDSATVERGNPHAAISPGFARAYYSGGGCSGQNDATFTSETRAECAAKCDELVGCISFEYENRASSESATSKCQISKTCESSESIRTSFWSSGWGHYEKLSSSNCFFMWQRACTAAGGGKLFEGDLSAAACQAKCAENAACQYYSVIGSSPTCITSASCDEAPLLSTYNIKTYKRDCTTLWDTHSVF